jgi:hypothetical protein
MCLLHTQLLPAKPIMVWVALSTLFAARTNAGTETSPTTAVVAGTSAEAPPPAPKWGLLYSPFDVANWLANFQATHIWQRKPALKASYTGPNSLATESETGYTLTATLFLGYRPWTQAEIFFNPEVIQSQEISKLTGMGGLSNGENQKGGGPTPTPYLARLFLRQTLNLGGSTLSVDAAPNQFATTIASRRLVLTGGFLAVTDIFDANSYSHDARTSLVNWALWTYGASDFAANSRGYTVGATIEYFHDAWAFRLGRFAQPKESNGLPLDYNIIAHYGDVAEVEHDHTILGKSGKVRLDGFHNYAKMGSFRDALADALQTGAVPSVANVRRNQSKFALGIGVEQALTQDAGLFARFSYNDGQTETYAYAEIERSFTVGAIAKGRLWRRPADTLGFAYALNGLSDAHRDYLSAGGLGFFIGDGALNYGLEQISEAFYSARVFGGMWVSVDGQYVVNPAYNKDRGPAKFLGVRFHIEL